MYKISARSINSTTKKLQNIAAKENVTGVLQKNNVVKSTRLPTGLLVVSLENNSPLSRIAVIFKAGNRYESMEDEGMVHRVRNLLGLPSSNYSAVTLSYETAFHGGYLQCSTDRDFLTYNLQCNRRYVLGALDSSLTELLCYPKFDWYNLEVTNEMMHIDHAMLRNDHRAYAVDLLHLAAFRGGSLGRSLAAPSRTFHTPTEEAVRRFFARHVTVANGALVAVGVDHDLLLEFAVERLRLPAPGAALPPPATAPAVYAGGEVRKERGGEHVVIALAVPGASLAEPKGQVLQALLASVLGAGPRTSHAFGGESRLGRTLRADTSAPFQLWPVSAAYSDAGLLGTAVACDAADGGRLARAVLAEWRRAAAQGVQEAELAAAKRRVKLDVLGGAESSDALLRDLAVQAALARADAPDFVGPAELARMVDGASLAEVNQLAKKVLDSKISMASVGNLQNTPYLDELGKV